MNNQEIAVETIHEGTQISLEKGMRFETRRDATSYIQRFALAQGKRAKQDRAKSGGSSMTYVCSSETKCSFNVRVL